MGVNDGMIWMKASLLFSKGFACIPVVNVIFDSMCTFFEHQVPLRLVYEQFCHPLSFRPVAIVEVSYCIRLICLLVR